MHIFQVGAGSGGMAVLDLVARDPRVWRVTLVEPDVYAAHNVFRHLFPPSAVGRPKVELAAEWLHTIRPELTVDALPFDLTDPAWQPKFARFVAGCDVGVCAADNEAAKYAFDALMRAAGKPWTLGEVLSGGIGGWVHRFEPGGACYGCVASYLKREVTEQPSGPPPDYSDPAGPRPETHIPASKASIAVVAGLHALVTLDAAACGFAGVPGAGARAAASGEGSGAADSPDAHCLLFSLRAVPGVFDAAFRPHRFRVPRSPTCLTCGAPSPPAGENLDAALADALARLGAK